MLRRKWSKGAAAPKKGPGLQPPAARFGGFATAVIVAAFMFAGVSWADEPVCRQPLVDRQRFGYTTHAYNWHHTFDFARLRAGWYVDHSFTTAFPPGMDRTVLVKLRKTVTREIIDPADVIPLVDQNPGAIWLIGNEPDQPNEFEQDALLPEEYARLYHDLYLLIKSRDRTSQVAAGGIVQPTPVRLQYLNKVLAAYKARYGRPMPVDLWHIHNAILNEVSCEYDPGNCWGALVPPGIDVGHGEIRTPDDNDSMTIFKAQIWAFRRWMADHGYRGYPLIVTEYGVLMPKSLGFNETRVNNFMSATFDFLQKATDPQLGDPSDGYRLVQRWAWFSLDGFDYDPVTGEGFNGFLFHQQTAAITASGKHFASHTSSFQPLSYIDLGVAVLRVSPDTDMAQIGSPVNRTVQVRLANVGTAASGAVELDLSYDGPAHGVVRGSISGLKAASSRWLDFSLTNLRPGAYTISATVDPDSKIAESLECNNQAMMTFVVPTDRAHLPPAFGLGVRAVARTGVQGVELESQPAVTSWPGDADPGVEEYLLPTGASYPGQLALDLSKGLVWVTERDGNKIARFAAESAQWREYGQDDGLSPNAKPWGIALDQAGNVWFAATGANKIGRLNPGTGQIKEFSIPTPNSQPWDVAVGDDGGIWFTEHAGDKIGRLDPGTGNIIEYPLQAGAQPSGIATRGNWVWFAETAANRIGWRNITTGSMSGLRRPSGSLPLDVVLPSSTRIWWTEPGANRIVLFAPSTLNPILEIDAPEGSEPFGIAMQGETAVWFTEKSIDHLGRYTGGTVPRQYELPTMGSEPTGIAIDGEGCAWYTAPGANRIGRLCPPPLDMAYLPVVSR
jgi:streptogramin lyase